MNNFILDRDSFVNEKYYNQNQDKLNEGIFDFLKTIAKQEWNSVKSNNQDVKKELEEADRKLTGFTLMKMKKSGKCTQIRQTLCDFANTLWDAKKKELEDGEKLQRMLMGLKDKGEISDEEEKQVEKAGTVSKYLKQFDIKDNALADNLKNYEKKINTLCDGDPDLTRWSNLLKNDIRNIVNNLIIKEYDKVADDEDKKKAADEIKKAQEKIKKQEEDQKKEDEEENKEAEKKQNDRLKKLEKERKTALSNLGVSPVDSNKTGDKVFQEINTEFSKVLDDMKINVDNLLKENELYEYSFENVLNEGKLADTVNHDSLIGIKDIPELVKNAKVKTNLLGTRILKELGIVFNVIDQLSDNGKTFKEIPGDSIQALYVGLTSVISHAMTDGQLDDNAKNLLARCAISDKTLGYGLPSADKNKPDGDNIFVAITTTLQKPSNQNAFMIKKKGEKKTLIDNLFKEFVKNINSMFNEVTKFAKKLKNDRKKEDKQEENKVKQEENNE